MVLRKRDGLFEPCFPKPAKAPPGRPVWSLVALAAAALFLCDRALTKQAEATALFTSSALSADVRIAQKTAIICYRRGCVGAYRSYRYYGRPYGWYGRN
jgi:hypothetical protein